MSKPIKPKIKPKLFNPTAKHPARSVQAWQILVGIAKNRQTVTYELLSKMMYQKKAAGVLDEILGHLAAFCASRGVPILTAIVVGKSRGTPGRAIPVAPDEIDGMRVKVYDYDWYNLYPPSEDELKTAFDKRDLGPPGV